MYRVRLFVLSLLIPFFACEASSLKRFLGCLEDHIKSTPEISDVARNLIVDAAIAHRQGGWRAQGADLLRRCQGLQTAASTQSDPRIESVRGRTDEYLKAVRLVTQTTRGLTCGMGASGMIGGMCGAGAFVVTRSDGYWWIEAGVDYGGLLGYGYHFYLGVRSQADTLSGDEARPRYLLQPRYVQSGEEVTAGAFLAGISTNQSHTGNCHDALLLGAFIGGGYEGTSAARISPLFRTYAPLVQRFEHFAEYF